MKRLSDYKGEEAIDLWAELMGPIGRVLQDENVRNALSDDSLSTMQKVQAILKNNKKEAATILLAIDDTPINGLNIIARLLDLVLEIENSEEFSGFFGSAEQKKEGESSGSATVNAKEETA